MNPIFQRSRSMGAKKCSSKAFVTCFSFCFRAKFRTAWPSFQSIETFVRGCLSICKRCNSSSSMVPPPLAVKYTCCGTGDVTAADHHTRDQ